MNLAFAVCALALLTASTLASKPPNLVVIFTDDQVHDAIGYSNPHVKTPNLDALAARGVIFDRAYVSSPICAASRASLMSGTFPQENGVVGLAQENFTAYRKGGEKAHLTLPSQLNQLGYHTVLHGKSHLKNPLHYGFQAGLESGPHDDVKTFANVKRFLETYEKNAPFFLWLAPHQPHMPLLPSQEWLDLYPLGSIALPSNFRIEPLPNSIFNQGVPGELFYRDSNYSKNAKKLSGGPPRSADVMKEFIQYYYAVVSHLDHQIGNFITQLQEAGEVDNTWIFFLSDNGYHLGDHGLGNKITMHEESVRVPMFAVPPKNHPEAKYKTRTESLVSSLDIYPTLLELAGGKAPDKTRGKSLVPLLNSPTSEHHPYIFSECVGVRGKPREGHRMVFNGTLKLVLTDADEYHLYNLKTDPDELKNIFPTKNSFPEELRRLHSELTVWMRSIGDRSAPPLPQQ